MTGSGNSDHPGSVSGRTMRRLLILAAALAIASCSTTPTPSTSSAPEPTTIVSPLPTSSPAAAAVPSPAALITDHIGRLTISHPAVWSLVPGPAPVSGGLVPLFYLSNKPLDVRPCPTANPTTHAFDGCPAPLAHLSPGDVLVTVIPNGGLAAMLPPQVFVQAPTDACIALGSDAQVFSVVGGVVVTGCIRGPDEATSEAELKAMIASIAGAF
jgi:hypothetical protein